jgi:hypothetical protein
LSKLLLVLIIFIQFHNIFNKVNDCKKVKFSLNWRTFSFVSYCCFTYTYLLWIIADISIGDAWLKKYYNDKIGSSLFVANSETEKKL